MSAEKSNGEIPPPQVTDAQLEGSSSSHPSQLRMPLHICSGKRHSLLEEQKKRPPEMYMLILA